MNDKIMYLMTFIGKETVDIELLNDFIDALSTNKDCDIPLDRYDINWILKGSKRAEIIAAQNQGVFVAFNTMQEVLHSLSDRERELSGAIIHFRTNPEFPFMEISSAMEVFQQSFADISEVIFGTTTNKDLPLDFVRITIICTGIEKTKMLAANNVY